MTNTSEWQTNNVGPAPPRRDQVAQGSQKGFGDSPGGSFLRRFGPSQPPRLRRLKYRRGSTATPGLRNGGSHPINRSASSVGWHRCYKHPSMYFLTYTNRHCKKQGGDRKAPRSFARRSSLRAAADRTITVTICDNSKWWITRLGGR